MSRSSDTSEDELEALLRETRESEETIHTISASTSSVRTLSATSRKRKLSSSEEPPLKSIREEDASVIRLCQGIEETNNLLRLILTEIGNINTSLESLSQQGLETIKDLKAIKNSYIHPPALPGSSLTKKKY